MGIYDDLIAAKGSGTVFDGLTPIDTVAASKQVTVFGLVPRDYLEFIVQVGFGELGEASFMLYGGLLEPYEVFGESNPLLDGLLLLGDDFQGFNMAFDTEDWSVVEIDPTNLSRRPVAKSFESFIRSKIASI